MSSEAGAGAGAGAGFRVTILHNGDFKTGGKALVIAPGTSLAELFDKAGKKLASGLFPVRLHLGFVVGRLLCVMQGPISSSPHTAL